MKVAEYIAAFLARQGITHVFELTGGMIAHVLDAIHLRGDIQLVSVHHEQVAAFAADAYGRLTGLPGVAMSTGGPGTTNFMTGIGSAYFDSSPAVFFSGAVNRHEMRGERAIRQLGFQEMDVLGMVRPITKGAWQLRSADELPELLVRAFRVAMEGRPGPTVIDLPLDLQMAKVDAREEDIPVVAAGRRGPRPPHAEIDFTLLAQSLAQARRPLILAGGGVRAAGAVEPLRELARRTGIPVVGSLLGMDVMPADDPLRAGFIGTYGNRWANTALMQADWLLVVGSRLDVRQTGARTAEFKGERAIFHVDVEPGEVNNRITGCHAILADVHAFAEQGLRVSAGWRLPDFGDWVREIAEMRRTWPDTAELDGVPGINPNAFLGRLSAASRGAAAYAVDVGQHQMWAAQSLQPAADQTVLTSGGMGAMGFSLGAAVGAAFVTAPRPVVVVAGDGGFQCNIQDLQTIVHHRLPVKMVVMNNGAHGMLRQFQDSYLGGRYQSSVWGYSAPPFARVAQAYGIPGRRIDDAAEVEDGLAWLWADPAAPALLEVGVDLRANAWPKVAFGRPLHEMEPLFEPIPFGEEGA